MATEIIVNISPTGEVTLEVDGHKGSSCTSVTLALEAAIGQAGARELKSDFYSHDQHIRNSN